MIETPATPQKSPQALVAECEALLFVAREPLSRFHLARLTGSTEQAVATAITRIRRFFRNSGIRLERLPRGYSFALASDVEHLVQSYRDEPHELSDEATETLAIIAYLQPVDEATIADLRTVPPVHALETLINANLIASFVDVNGSTRYATTETFLFNAGLQSLDDLPPIQMPPVLLPTNDPTVTNL